MGVAKPAVLGESVRATWQSPLERPTDHVKPSYGITPKNGFVTSSKTIGSQR